MPLQTPSGMRPTRRHVSLALAAATLSACALSFPVDFATELPLVAFTGESSSSVPIDLAENESIWKHRKNVEEYSIEAVHARIVGVGPSNEATTADVDLFVREDGAPEDGSADVLAVRVQALPVEEGAEIELSGTREVEDVLLRALKGSGRLTVVVATHGDARVEAVLELRIAGEVQYEVIGR